VILSACHHYEINRLSNLRRAIAPIVRQSIIDRAHLAADTVSVGQYGRCAAPLNSFSSQSVTPTSRESEIIVIDLSSNAPTACFTTHSRTVMDYFRRFTFLFAAPVFDTDDLEGLRFNQIVTEIERSGFEVVRARRLEDAEIAVQTDAAIGCRQHGIARDP
jgi:hypothetical protein